jgi:hypothetical protein
MVWTLMRGGLGVSRGGSRAQLEMPSTALNLRSERGRCRPTVELRTRLVSLTGRVQMRNKASKCHVHVDDEVSLEHELINLSRLGHDLLGPLGQEKQPSVDHGVGGLEDLLGRVLGGDFGGGGYCQRGAIDGADEVGKGGKGDVFGGELSRVKVL